MLEYLALILMSTQTQKPYPNLKIGHCYSSFSDYRPNTIGISGIERGMYKYHAFYSYDSGWSGVLYGKIFTLNFVYNKEVRCP